MNFLDKIKLILFYLKHRKEVKKHMISHAPFDTLSKFRPKGHRLMIFMMYSLQQAYKKANNKNKN